MKTTGFSQKSNTFPLLCGSIPRTELSDILEIAFNLLDRNPGILKRIDEDLEAHGIAKKKMRLADRAWALSHGVLPGFETEGYMVPEKLELCVGRPKEMNALMIYLFIVLRGYFTSLTSTKAIDRIRDSRTVNDYIKAYGLGEIPARSTVHENVNAVSEATRDYIHQRQLVMIIDEGLDDFSKLILDSTAVKANSSWPTDSGILKDLLRRAYKNSQKLNEYDVPNFTPWFMETWLEDIGRLHFRIIVTSGKGSVAERRKLYKKLYKEVDKAISHMSNQIERHRGEKEAVDLCPRLSGQLNRLWSSIEDDITDARKVVTYSSDRILHDKNRSGSDKIASLSDGSAAFIKKGGRDIVIGYRPQIGRSGNGFITVLHVPEGNAFDSPQLASLVEKALENTGVLPENVSTDDGYASDYGVKALHKMKIGVISISGSKGKALTSEEDWLSELYKETRRNRSSVESLIFVLKYLFDFGRLKRRGIDAVRIELLEKAIVQNFRHMALLLERRRKQPAA